jgi:hypothetical protein
VGVEGVVREYGVPLRVVKTREPAGVTGPAFVHFLVGQHRDYASKNAAVLRLLESPNRAERPVVLLKYCDEDIRSPDDSGQIFDAYRDTVDTIRADHPDVSVVHTTMSLTLVESAFKSGVKRLLGRTTQRQAAIARHRFNELVRAEFGATEPVFDVARVEATRQDGKSAAFSSGGDSIETLARDNSYDGTRLTDGCRRIAASTLLDVLSNVIEGAQ